MHERPDLLRLLKAIGKSEKVVQSSLLESRHAFKLFRFQLQPSLPSSGFAGFKVLEGPTSTVRQVRAMGHLASHKYFCCDRSELSFERFVRPVQPRTQRVDLKTGIRKLDLESLVLFIRQCQRVGVVLGRAIANGKQIQNGARVSNLHPDRQVGGAH